VAVLVLAAFVGTDTPPHFSWLHICASKYKNAPDGGRKPAMQVPVVAKDADVK